MEASRQKSSNYNAIYVGIYVTLSVEPPTHKANLCEFIVIFIFKIFFCLFFFFYRPARQSRITKLQFERSCVTLSLR